MPLKIACPECAAALTVPDAVVGKTIRCKACGGTFKAAAALPRPAKAVGSPVSRPAGPKPARPKPKPPSAEFEEDDDEEEEDRPAAKGTGRPRDKAGRAKKRSSKTPLLLMAAAGVAVLLAAGGVTAYILGAFDDSGTPVRTEKVPPAEPKESVGPDGERVAPRERVALTMKSDPGPEPDSVFIVISFRVTGGGGLADTERLVVAEASRMYSLHLEPQFPDEADKTKGTFTLILTPDARRRYKKFWIAANAPPNADVKKDGIRISNVVAAP